ncbi:unnamed protein product [Victoria cruziana]
MERSPALVWLSLLLGLGMLIHGTRAQNSPQDFVDAHNAARAEVGVDPISWDDTVAAYAQNYADQRMGDCNLVHSQGPYGENLAGSTGSEFTAAEAVNMWVAEKSNYDYNSNSCASGTECLHYTQVVWRDSKNLGCARVECNNGGTFIICNYNPPGNVIGQRPF